MPCQAPRKPSNQEKLMLGTSVGTKTIAQMRFHTASAGSGPSMSECDRQWPTPKQNLTRVQWTAEKLTLAHKPRGSQFSPVPVF